MHDSVRIEESKGDYEVLFYCANRSMVWLIGKRHTFIEAKELKREFLRDKNER